MDIKELKTKKEAELQSLLSSERDKLRELRFKDANKQLKNVKEINATKVNIARILTVLNAEEIK